MRNCTKEEGPQDPSIKNWVHATLGCRADVLMLMMGRRLAMGKLENSTRPGPQFCLQCTRWQYAGVCAGLTKHPLPLYHFVHMIVFSEYSTSSLFTTYSSTWKANEPILIFPGNSASAAIKLLSSVIYFFAWKIGWSLILPRRHLKSGGGGLEEGGLHLCRARLIN